MTFGTWLEDTRVRSAKTKQQIATALNVSPGAVGHWVSDRRTMPRHKWPALCRLFDLGPQAIQAGEDAYFGRAPVSER